MNSDNTAASAEAHSAIAPTVAAAPAPAPAAPTGTPPTAFSSTFFSAAAAADSDAPAVTIPLAAAPVSQLSTRSPAFTPAPPAPSPTAPSFNAHAKPFVVTAKPFVFKDSAAVSFVPGSSSKLGGPSSAPFQQPNYNSSDVRTFYPATQTGFSGYGGPAVSSPYGSYSVAPYSGAAAAPAAPSLMMNQFGQWVPAYPVAPAAYAPPPSQLYRPQPVIVPPPPVIIIKPLGQQPAFVPQPHSLQAGQQPLSKGGKQRKGPKQQMQPQPQPQGQFPLPQQELPQFPPAPQQPLRPPQPFVPASTHAAAAASAAPAEPLTKSQRKKLEKLQQKQEQKQQKQQQQQSNQQAQQQEHNNRRPGTADPAIATAAPAPAPATDAPPAAAAASSRVRPLTARAPPMVRNPAAAASAAFAAAGTAAAAPAAAVAAPASVPSADLTFIAYFGSPRSSQGMHATKRSMADLINALCGRDVHEAASHAAPQTPFAQNELRALQRRAASQLGSASKGDSKPPIRLTEFESLVTLDDAVESLLNGPEPSALAPAPKSSSPTPSASSASVPASRDSPMLTDLASEDVTLPVSQFAEIAMAVDARNRIVHMHVAAPDTAAPGLSLGLDAPLGFERVDCMEELARLPLSVLQSMDESAFTRWIVSGTSQQLRAALVLFCTAHHIIIAHPAPQLQMEWIEALRMLAALKSRLFAAFAKEGAAVTSADATACAAMYRSLFSSLSLTEPELKLLSRQSSALPLCFTPSLSFVVQPPSFLLGRAWDERKVALSTESFHKQLTSICAHFGLTASNAAASAAADVSPAACESMLLFKAAATASADVSSGGISTARFYKPSARQNKNTSPSDEKMDDDDASAPAQMHVTPLFFLHTQQPVIATDFAALFGESDDDDFGVVAPVAEADPAALVSLRVSLERSIFVARAHIESLHTGLPRDVLSSGAAAFFSAECQLRCVQTVHAWIVDRTSPVASALDSTLLQTLHVDYQFSASRCEHASAVAKKIYLNAQQSAANARASAATPPASSPTPTAGATGQDVPSTIHRTANQYYSSTAHRQRLETVVRLFHSLVGAGPDDAAPSSAPAPPLSPTRAVGPAVSAFEAALRRELESYWLQSHRGCDATSVFGHACVLPHGHAEQSLDNIAASSWPVEHAAVTHSLRLSCHCGASLLKLSKEPFDLSALRLALTDRCCSALVEPIGRQVFSGLPVDGGNGWNVFRLVSSYNPATGFAHLSGFYPKAARTAFLPSVRLMLPEPHADRAVEVQMGLEFECPLGHRWIQPDTEDDSSKDVSASPTSASAVDPVCRGFPRRDTFLFLPCLICRYLRHLQHKAATDAAADARQKRLHADEKRGRAMLQREEKKSEQERSFAQPTVPSSTVRSHDRYAQLRRMWVVTPSMPLLTISALIKSTRPFTQQPGGTATAALGGSTTVTQQFDRLTLLRGESSGSFVGTASITPTTVAAATGGSGGSRFVVRPAASVSSSAVPSLVHSRETDVPDNFSPLAGAVMPADGTPRPTLPPSSFVAIEVPFVLTRQGQCLSSSESRYCILQSHMITPS